MSAAGAEYETDIYSTGTDPGSSSRNDHVYGSGRRRRTMNAPCMGCEKRHANCHSECEEYKEYLKKFEKEKLLLAEEKKIDNVLNGLQHNRALKKPNTVPGGKRKKKL